MRWAGHRRNERLQPKSNGEPLARSDSGSVSCVLAAQPARSARSRRAVGLCVTSLFGPERSRFRGPPQSCARRQQVSEWLDSCLILTIITSVSPRHQRAVEPLAVGRLSFSESHLKVARKAQACRSGVFEISPAIFLGGGRIPDNAAQSPLAYVVQKGRRGCLLEMPTSHPPWKTSSSSSKLPISHRDTRSAHAW